MNDIIECGKYSVLKKNTEEVSIVEDSTNEIRLHIGLRLTSSSEGIFLHVMSNGETRITQLTADSTDPLTLDLYNWAQSLVRARTYT